MSKILERLAKLMEMSGSDNEHEASVAAERASELMAREQLTIADVTAYVAGQSVVSVETGRVDDEQDAPMSKRCEMWHQLLCLHVVEAFGGRMWRNHRQKSYIFQMVGPPTSVSAARYVYCMLEREVGRLARAEMKRRGESNSWRRAYARGMSARIGERLKAGRASVMQSAVGTAMIFVGAQQKAVDDHIGNMNLKVSKGGQTKTPGALHEGYRDGETVELPNNMQRGLKAPSKELKS